jgi:hypothetical protein
MENTQPCPQARSEQLLSTELPDGLLVYDLDRDHGHFLNRPASLIWEACDGHTTVAQLAQRLAARGLPDDEEVVHLALQRLSKAHLLHTPLPRSPGVTRRRMVRKLGLAGLAALLPAVISLTAPTPAMAASGGGVGGGGGDN